MPASVVRNEPTDTLSWLPRSRSPTVIFDAPRPTVVAGCVVTRGSSATFWSLRPLMKYQARPASAIRPIVQRGHCDDGALRAARAASLLAAEAVHSAALAAAAVPVRKPPSSLSIRPETLS